MAKFNVGDRVRRTTYDNGPIKVGHEYTIEKLGPGLDVYLEGHPYLVNSSEYFELVVPEPVGVKYLVFWKNESYQLYDNLEDAKFGNTSKPIFEVIATHESKTEYVRTEV